MAASTKYRAFDELLEHPRVRILRFVRRFDWASSSDIYHGLTIQQAEINLYNKTLSRMVADGELDRRGGRTNWNDFRVTPKGEDKLRQILARATITEEIE